jgi:hypothetical protein
MQIFRTPTPQKGGLLSMPPEILEVICSQALAEDEPLSIREGPENYCHIFYEKRKLTVRGLGLSCLKIYLDITEHQFFYTNNEFKFDHIEAALSWLHRRTHEERQALRSLSIPFDRLHIPGTVEILLQLRSLSNLTLDLSPLIQDICFGDQDRHQRVTALITILAPPENFQALRDFVKLTKLEKLSFSLHMLFQREGVAAREFVLRVYYDQAKNQHGGILRAIAGAGVQLPDDRQAGGKGPDEFLREVLGFQLRRLQSFWQKIYFLARLLAKSGTKEIKDVFEVDDGILVISTTSYVA